MFDADYKDCVDSSEGGRPKLGERFLIDGSKFSAGQRKP